MASPDTPATRRQVLESRVKLGSSWLWSVVGFTILNTILIRVGSEWSFCVGIMVAGLNDYIAVQYVRDASHSAPALVTALSLALDALLVGSFALVARACGRRRRWFLLAGLCFYALDTALVAFAQSWPSLIYHALTLHYGFRAFRALGELQRLPPADAVVAVPAEPAVEATPMPGSGRRYTGWPAAIVGLAVVGAVAVLLIYVCRQADTFVANR